MSELVTWLRAQLDEDERIAKAATPSPWRWRTPDANHLDQSTIFGDGLPRGRDKLRQVCNVESAWEREANAEHIIRQNPARALREVEAKRAILDGIADADPHSAYITGTFTAWGMLRLLALPYADRPGYRDEWRP